MRKRLDKWCENGILLLVLSVLAFGPLATGAVRPQEFLILQGLTAAALCLWLPRFWLNPGHRLLWPPVCWAVLAFVVYGAIRYRTADVEYVARQELIRILVYAVLFFLIVNNLSRSESTQQISFLLVFLAMANAMYGIYQFATHSDHVWHFIKPELYRNRGSGTYICPNHFAGFLEIILPLGLAYTWLGRVSHLTRLFLGYASLATLAGIGFSVSRGAWIATAVVVVLFFGLLFGRRRYRIPAIICLLVAAGAAFYVYRDTFSFQQRFQGLFETSHTDFPRSRLAIWKAAIAMWRDNPWFGVGPGHFDCRFPGYRPEDLQARPGFTHNDYLNLLADWGLAGSIIVAAAFILLYVGAFSTWRFVRRRQGDLATKSGNRGAFVVGASLGLLAILIHSFTDFNLHVPANAILAVALMALLSGHTRFATERYWVNPGWTGRILVTLAGLLVLGYLGQQGWRRGHEVVWLLRAGKEVQFNQSRLDALKQAAIHEPMNSETANEIGETLRTLSWQGDSNYQQLARDAIQWFERGIRLNPFDPYNYAGAGMCLDWLGQHDQAAPYYVAAVKRDPNNYYILTRQGWHFFQIEDYVTARKYFERSLTLYHPWHNPVAASYLAIIDRKLKERPPPAEQ